MGLTCEDDGVEVRDKLERLGFEKIQRQLTVLEKTCRVKFDFSSEERGLIDELSLVRNLGMHNRWEVNSYYLKRTKEHRFAEGELRVFDQVELQRWHGALNKAIRETSSCIAQRFVEARPYPIAE